MRELSVLDVGCGDAAHGDVNTDLYLSDIFNHRSNDTNREYRFRLDTKKLPNFVLCDGCYLPFKDESFDIVTSCQVIEHVFDPVLMLREMIRVSKDIVIVEIVHRRGERLLNKSRYRELNKVHINK